LAVKPVGANRLGSLAIIGLLLLSTALGLTLGAGPAHAGGPPAPRGESPLPGAPLAAGPHDLPVHGDLVISAANSPYILSPATTGVTNYFQEGNVTVLPGGELYVLNLTLSILQFISDQGTVGQRASHLYNFTVEGLVVFNDSVLTTNTSVLNVYTKLIVNVTDGGTLVAQSSTFAFPGQIEVSGSASRFYANDSYILPNPAVPSLKENTSLLHDSSYAPGLEVSGGARATLAGSYWLGYYADNVSLNGQTGLNLTNDTPASVDHNGNLTWSELVVPTPVASALALALAYPSVATGLLFFDYQAVGGANLPAGSHLTFNDVSYPLPQAVDFPGTAVNVTEQYVVPVSASFIAAVNQAGMLALLQATGDFGTPSTMAVTLDGAPGALDILSMHLVLAPSYPFNMVVQGGSTFTAVDSTLALNWNVLPGTPVDHGVPAPEPWNSNKLTLSGGSFAVLANVSTPTSFSTPFDNQSIVLPLDAASRAYIYRWALVRAVSGAFGPIPNVRVVAFPAYNASESSNATSLALNNVSSTDPDLAEYVTHWAATNHRTLGITGDTGAALMLLASTVITSDDLPSGGFIGAYHFGTVLPGGGPGATVWQYGDVSPYPLGMTPAGPDPLPTAGYPNYRAELSIGTVGISANNQTVGNATVAIGQTLRLTVPITNVGTAALVNFTAVFSLLATAPFPPVQLAPVQLFSQLNAGDTQFVNFSWVVNETIIGLGGNKSVTFAVNATWNGGIAPIGGIVTAKVPMTVVPSYIALTFTSPTGPLTLGTPYLGIGKVTFAGKGVATVNVTFIGPGGRTLVATDSYASGPFQTQIQPPTTLQAGGTYTVLVTAYYNGRTVSYTASPVQIAGSPPPPPSFWNTDVFGPITWLYLIIIIAAVLAAAIAFLLLTGRLSRGKLVECGECGSLIPASATVCPKCGAEFEVDLVRCSRCASTIPAASEVCPECAAQLLGTPEPESKDPERQGYADFVERYRAEAKKELADNYTEGAFWDWWKRQPSYVSFNQWKLQQSASSRVGMTAPVVSPTESAEPVSPPAPAPPRRPPTGGAGAAPPDRAGAPTPPAAKPATAPPVPPPRRGAAPGASAAPAPATASTPPSNEASAPAGGTGMRPCSNCGKEIPSDFLVCPFCGAVTR
jgi:RNA polymerase subunit RPABC4/transcription elongation factor Spt4